MVEQPQNDTLISAKTQIQPLRKTSDFA